MRLLVTGFGPFPSMPRNPSAALAAAVAASPRLRLLGIRAECRILTTAYAALPAELDPALDAKPDAVLMIGVAGRSSRVRVERRATSRRSALFADASGETAGAPVRSGPPARESGLNCVEAFRLLRAAGVRARISRDAGRYLCNAAYYRALGRESPAVFIHIPKPVGSNRPAPRARRRSSETARLGAALVAVAVAAIRTARVAGTRAPTLHAG